MKQPRFRPGELVHISGDFSPVLIVKGAGQAPTVSWLTVRYPDGRTKEANVRNCYRDTPEWRAWANALATYERAAAAVNARALLGLGWAEQKAKRSVEFVAWQRAGEECQRTGKLCFAVHPYWK
jgi:hypothetical protein